MPCGWRWAGPGEGSVLLQLPEPDPGSRIDSLADRLLAGGVGCRQPRDEAVGPMAARFFSVTMVESATWTKAPGPSPFLAMIPEMRERMALFDVLSEELPSSVLPTMGTPRSTHRSSVMNCLSSGWWPLLCPWATRGPGGGSSDSHSRYPPKALVDVVS